MEMIFLNAAGTVLFVRDDMEQGNWTQEEYTVNATFPYIDGKVIQRGQRIAFRDPATNNIEVFEIRNVTNIEPEHYQQFIAENIAVSELSDEHLNATELTDKTAAQALTTILTGTLWSLGNNTASGTSSADIVRGSVWNGVSSIIQNWNVYITPRITFNSAGSITGRYLDISPAQGTWRGVRLSIEKNMLDSSVIYDDTDVITAMYGYGGNIDVEQQTTLDTTEELTFKDVVWTQTADHPAKPANQTYLEYPEKTALYGRNGRPRYGYYQNSDIKDANVLLQKTWETLKQTCDPKISISGMVADLYRLGYADQPLRLHDTVIIEIKETGEKFEKTIIKLDVDLIDPTSTRPEIGDYIPNIIYINRDSEEKASGGGGGGGRGQTNEEKKEYDTFYDLSANTDELGSWISMVVGKRNGSTYIKAGEITLSINSSSGESTALINADHVNISATSDIYTLAGDLTHDAQGRLVIKNAGGMYVERNEQGTTAYFGVWDRGNLTGGVMVQQINGQTTNHITADHINISSTSTAHLLSGSIVYNEWGNLVLKESSGGGIYVEHNDGQTTAAYGIWDKGNLTGGVMVQQINGQQGTKLTLQADVIDINGIVQALQALTVTVSYLNVTNGLDCGDIECGAVNGTSLDTNGGAVYCGDLDADSITAGGTSHNISWKSQGVVATIGVTSIKKNFKLADDSSWNHYVVTDVGKTTATINYLGY